MEDYVEGTCSGMCPHDEAHLRRKEHLLHKYELKKGTEGNKIPDFDPEKIVKSFVRSAAGTQMTKPSNLRPFPVLLRTVDYLFKEIFPKHKDEALVVYNFMFDRLRAVRQDAVIQNLCHVEMIRIFEPIVRFLIYFGYILIEEDFSDFDPQINNTHLQECMKRLLLCYDECCETNPGTRWDVESSYLLFNLGNMKALTRACRICTNESDPMYKFCVQLSFHWFTKNYFRVLKMITELPPLLFSVINISLPEIRMHALKAMAFGYSCANSSYPVLHLKKLLLYESNTQVCNDCNHFNVKISDEKINFLKKDFNMNAEYPKGGRFKWVDEMFKKYDLVSLLRFGSSNHNVSS